MFFPLSLTVSASMLLLTHATVPMAHAAVRNSCMQLFQVPPYLKLRGALLFMMLQSEVVVLKNTGVGATMSHSMRNAGMATMHCARNLMVQMLQKTAECSSGANRKPDATKAAQRNAEINCTRVHISPDALPHSPDVDAAEHAVAVLRSLLLQKMTNSTSQ